jgi:hypothetical protein
MFDLHLLLKDEPGSLARFGAAMGDAGVSVEGGGVFTVDGVGHAHFLFDDGNRARAAAEAAGLEVIGVTPVLVRRLKQDQPGQLGAIGRALEAAGVNVITQYSDHSNQLILVTDDADRATAATAEWVS